MTVRAPTVVKTGFVTALLAATVLCSRVVDAQTELSAEDVAFLQGCGVARADIDVIPGLPEDGRNNLELVVESPRRHCDMQPVKAFIATREFLKKFTPPPEVSPMPPAEYNRIYLTPAEAGYVIEINKRILDKQLQELGK